MKYLALAAALALLPLALNAFDLLIIGDSVTTGADATPGNGWPSLVANAEGLAMVNLSHGSAGVADMGNQVYPRYVGIIFGKASPDHVQRGQRSAMQCGFNDHRDWGTNANFLEHYELATDGIAGWLLIPDESKVLGSAANATGAWTPMLELGGVGIQSSNLGDSVNFQAAGSVVYVAIYSRAASASPWKNGISGRPQAEGGEFRIIIDGHDKGTLSCHNAFGDRKAVNGGDNNIPVTINGAPHLYRFAGLGPGTHEITLIVSSGGTPAGFLWASGNAAFADRAGLPELRLSGVIRMTPGKYAAMSLAGSVEAADAFDARTAAVAARWFADGAAAAFVPLPSYDPVTGSSVSTSHPNTAGHAAIAADFRSPAWARLRISPGHGIELLSAPGAAVPLASTVDFRTWTPLARLAEAPLVRSLFADIPDGAGAVRIVR